jgi:hypothetical protein
MKMQLRKLDMKKNEIIKKIRKRKEWMFMNIINIIKNILIMIKYIFYKIINYWWSWNIYER